MDRSEFTADFEKRTSLEHEFEQLYRGSYELVYNFVRARMGDSHAAEDVVAEAYLRAARAFGSFDPARAKFSTWVTKIAVNCMNDYYRRHKAAVALDDVAEPATALLDNQDHFADKDLVDRLMGRLNADERNLVALKYHEGYRNVDIAAELGMNPSTVSTVLARALSKMRAAALAMQWPPETPPHMP